MAVAKERQRVSRIEEWANDEMACPGCSSCRAARSAVLGSKEDIAT